MMRKILLFLAVITLLFSQENPALEVQNLNKQLKILNQKLDNENVWIRKYNNALKYNTIITQINHIQMQLKRIRPSTKNVEQIQSLNARLETLQRQKSFFSDYEGNPYKELTEIKEIADVPDITNPVLIFSGFSFIKQTKTQLKTLKNNQVSLEETLNLLSQKKEVLAKLLKLQEKIGDPKTLDTRENEISEQIQVSQNIKTELETARSILETSIEVFGRTIDELDLRVSRQIQSQTLKIIYVLMLCVLVFIFAFAIKLTLRNYLDHERLYIANKIVNFAYITIIVFILLLSYLNNITYLVTFLGFVSAGLAFAMRDLFMSVLGWFVIVIGGGLHTGDRIRIHRDSTTYVGDILDISMTRITLIEDVTFNTCVETRRAGRIIFIPNNFIFNTVISNYTHSGMTTVWDGLDFTITFDSNYKKAIEIASEIARKHSKAHTDIGRKRMMRLKEHYSLKRISLEPRVFNMIEPNGMKISLWYQTNAYSTLNIRSVISGEIISAIAKEDDIKIAYPTTKIVNTGSDGVWERFTQEKSDETKSIF